MPALSGERLKEIKAQKTAYLTTKLGLTTEEAQRFWPIYNEYDDAREKLRKEMRELHKSGKEEGGLTEATAKVMLTKGLDIRTRELELERTYSERFSKSIGALKTVQLVKAERDFNRGSPASVPRADGRTARRSTSGAAARRAAIAPRLRHLGPFLE